MDIAIIGMSCRFSDAGDHKEFWKNLEKGLISVREIPPERWRTAEYYSPDISQPGKTASKWCGALDGYDRFDNPFFKIPDREAARMDPQQRLLLEEAWHCVEDSGLPLSELQVKRNSVCSQAPWPWTTWFFPEVDSFPLRRTPRRAGIPAFWPTGYPTP